MWLLVFFLAFLTVAVSTVYAIRASYWSTPLIERHGLDFDVNSDGKLLVGRMTEAGEQETAPSATVVAVNGRAVPRGFVVANLAAAFEGPEPAATVTLRQPDGRTVVLPVPERPQTVSAGAERERNLRIWTRLSTALLACAALLACSGLLALRRPNDPVAMLLAFAFTGVVATIDPPLQFWLWTDRGWVVDALGGVFFYLLLLGLAVFPDGVFVPRFLRWLIPLGIPLAVFFSVPTFDEDVQGITAILVLLAVLVGLFIRFRREPAGIARQQLKWAGFGFFAGLLLILAAVILAAFLGEDSSRYTAMMALAVLVLFSLGMATIALGLLVALTRFRLWEADTVITRSAAYAVVTIIVGIVWAASSDLVKLIITEGLGRESEAGATTVGAIVAAGIFAPTQNVVLGWTRRRFGGPVERIHGAAKRLKTWGMTETPGEVAIRALAIIDEAVHPSAAAILMDSASGRETIALRGVESADDPKLIDGIMLADEESAVGELRLGRRSDGNRYNSHELEAVRELVPPLAEALRVARGRYSRESQMQAQLEQMAARLAQLEGGTPKPA